MPCPLSQNTIPRKTSVNRSMNKNDADQKKAFTEGHLLGVLYAGN
jgi:hypothetical protein